MKNQILIASIIFLFLFSCKKENPYLITKHSIGLLTDSTQVKDLKMIYAKDSIVKFIAGDEFIGNINDIDIYEKGGKKLLSLSPSEALDSTATIHSIKVIDARYKTEQGVSISSTFKDIKANYTITKIENTIRNAVIFVKEDNCFFTIDKKELPANLRFDMNKKIDAVQIPDTAKIKYFMIGWY
jgi:hypothetical protein